MTDPSHVRFHRCDEQCLCPACGAAMFYSHAGDEHACSLPDCAFAVGETKAMKTWMPQRFAGRRQLEPFPLGVITPPPTFIPMDPEAAPAESPFRSTDDILADARKHIAELRAEGIEPTGWLVDLVDDNLIRYERPPTMADRPLRSDLDRRTLRQ